jgi:hypothetical protein
MLNEKLNIAVSRMAKAGLRLEFCTVANKQYYLFNINTATKRNIKVCVGKNLEVEVIDFTGLPRIIDSGFYINPKRVEVAAERIKNTLRRLGVIA